VLVEQFPLECDDSSKPHGYKWKTGAKGISIPSLTLHESLLLNMAESYLRNLMPQSVMRAMDGFFLQARYDLNPGTPNARKESRWLRKVRVVSESMPLLSPEIKPGVLEAVSQALYNETWLELDYTNANGERKPHRVMPLGLAQQGARLVLVVRYEGYDNERSLALNRAHKATDTQLPFPPVNDFDLAQYDEDGRFGFGSGKTIQLKFRIEKPTGLFLTESRLSKDQVVVDLGAQLEFTATVVESARLVWWLRGFGKRVEVLAPTDLALRVSEA
jgi:predicted DNA-binding transcriptional regulator YafY